MRQIRFVSELIIFVVALSLFALGLEYQVARGLGLMLGSVMVGVFIIEFFLFARAPKENSEFDRDAYIARRVGFNWRDDELMDANNITKEDVAYITEWYEEHKKEKESYKKFWTKEFLDRIPPIGMNWASGFTPALEKFSSEGKEETLPLDEHFFFVGYKKEIELTERVLAQNGRNNILLVGSEGVGNGFVLRGLERLIESGRTLPILSYKRFVWLDSAAILSGMANPGELRARMEGIFHDVMYAGNIVLAIERIDAFFDPAFPEIADIVVPFLQSERSQVVATVTPEALTLRFNRPDILTQFAKITIEEPSLRHSILALEEVAAVIEARDHIFIPYQVIKKVIEMADRFSIDTARPQKDIDLLQEVVSFAKSKGKSLIEELDVLEVLSQRSGIPLGVLGEDEKQKLLHLEETLHKKLIDQKEAVSAIAKALKRARIEVRETKRPIGSFLFLGPTGVGKTTAAKALAQLYFGKEEQMVRFDMSEYQNIEDANRLIDALSRQVKQHPYGLLLLDELEKASRNILNLFLQILDEGMFTDTDGFKVDFRNLIIIATSNAGSEFIRSNIERVGSDAFERELLDMLQKNNIFSPEFLNRFDALVTFKPLGIEELTQIAALMLSEFTQQLKNEHHITFTSTPDLIDFLVNKGFSPEYGARPMRRLLQDTLQTLIADKLLKEQVKKGDTLTVSRAELEAYVKQ